MIISRSLIKEVFQTSLVVTLIISSIFIVLRIMGFLSQAAEGVIPVDAVFTLVFLKMIAYLDVIIPLVFYIALMLVMNRWYRDQEMAILSSAGVSLFDFLRPIGVIALITTLVVSLFSFYLTPKSVGKGYVIENEYRQSNEITGIIPGVFVESKGGSSVYFVEEFNKKTNQYENVFVYDQSYDTENVVVSNYAKRLVDEKNGDEFLVLQGGTRYEGQPGTPEYRIVDFATYALRIEYKKKAIKVMPTRSLASTDIMKSDDTKLIAEWYWRIAKILLIPVLAIFALALSFEDTRGGRSTGLFVALLIYLVYSNLSAYTVALVKKGQSTSGLSVWVVHLIFLLIGLYLLYRRNYNLPFMPDLSFLKPKKAQVKQ